VAVNALLRSRTIESEPEKDNAAVNAFVNTWTACVAKDPANESVAVKPASLSALTTFPAKVSDAESKREMRLVRDAGVESVALNALRVERAIEALNESVAPKARRKLLLTPSTPEKESAAVKPEPMTRLICAAVKDNVAVKPESRSFLVSVAEFESPAVNPDPTIRLFNAPEKESAAVRVWVKR
jgi:hypothetical protein